MTYTADPMPPYNHAVDKIVAALDELHEIGFDEYLSRPGICAVEWANRFPERIPGTAIWVTLSIAENNERLICW